MFLEIEKAYLASSLNESFYPASGFLTRSSNLALIFE